MWRRGVCSGLVVALLVSVAAAATTSASAANRTAARRDADSRLAKVVLPPGATRLTSEPSGDNGYLKPQPVLEGDMANVVASQWWQVPATPSEVTEFVKAHPPAGARQSGTSTTQNGNGASAVSVSFRWPPVPGVLGDRMLTLTATMLRSGDSGVLLESQSDWVVLRASSERIPAAVRRIQVTSAVLGRRVPSIAFSVTRRSWIRATLRLINSMPVAQPVTYVCPAETDPRVITMTFQRANGAALAVLTYMDWRPWLSPSIACKTVGLTIAGRRQRPLLGGNFLLTLTKLLGRPLV